jgi:hypothetical protein
VSDYRLDDWGLISGRSKGFSSRICVLYTPGLRPTQVPNKWALGFFPRGKARLGRDAGHSPHLVPKSIMSRNYIVPLSLVTCMAVWGQLYFTNRTNPSYGSNIRTLSGFIQGWNTVFVTLTCQQRHFNGPSLVHDLTQLTVYQPAPSSRRVFTAKISEQVSIFKLQFFSYIFLHNLYSSRNIVRMIRSRRIRWWCNG